MREPRAAVCCVIASPTGLLEIVINIKSLALEVHRDPAMRQLLTILGPCRNLGIERGRVCNVIRQCFGPIGLSVCFVSPPSLGITI